jgi:hypothetical protein
VPKAKNFLVDRLIRHHQVAKVSTNGDEFGGISFTWINFYTNKIDNYSPKATINFKSRSTLLEF